MGGDHTCYGCGVFVGEPHVPNCRRAKGPLVTEADTVHVPLGLSGNLRVRPGGLVAEAFGDRPISPSSSGGEVARRLADLAIGVFGSAHPTEEQREALAESLIAHATRWINDEFKIGLREPERRTPLELAEQARAAVQSGLDSAWLDRGSFAQHARDDLDRLIALLRADSLSACKCRKLCGDVDESHDPHGVCKALPRGPQTPLIEIVLVPREEARRDA